MIDLSSLRPLDAGVLLLRLPDNEYRSTLIIPDIAQKPSHRGKVVRTGKGRRAKDGSYLPLAVKLDDVVYYQTSDIDDGTHVLIQEGDILGIEEPQGFTMITKYEIPENRTRAIVDLAFGISEDA